MHLTILETAATGAVILNLLVTIYLLQRSDLERFQKIAQIVMVWLIPYVAALSLWLFNKSHDDVTAKNRRFFGRKAQDSVGQTSFEPSGHGD